MFPGAPLFDDLAETDLASSTNPHSSNQGKMTIQELDDQKEHIQDELDSRKRRRRRRKDPTVRTLREHLRKIAMFHTKIVEDELPSVYPILGPGGGKSDDEDCSASDNASEQDKNSRRK